MHEKYGINVVIKDKIVIKINDFMEVYKSQHPQTYLQPVSPYLVQPVLGGEL